MRAKPIRRSLLLHNVQYISPAKTSTWEPKEPGKEGTWIQHVRLEPVESFSYGAQEKAQASARLFWDAVHSTPCVWEVGGRVVWNETVFSITGVQTYYDRAKLHHVEVMLL